MLGAVSCLSIYNMIGVDYSKHVRVYVDLHAMTAVPSKCAGLYKKNPPRFVCTSMLLRKKLSKRVP